MNSIPRLIEKTAEEIVALIITLGGRPALSVLGAATPNEAIENAKEALLTTETALALEQYLESLDKTLIKGKYLLNTYLTVMAQVILLTKHAALQTN